MVVFPVLSVTLAVDPCVELEAVAEFVAGAVPVVDPVGALLAVVAVGDAVDDAAADGGDAGEGWLIGVVPLVLPLCAVEAEPDVDWRVSQPASKATKSTPGIRAPIAVREDFMGLPRAKQHYLLVLDFAAAVSPVPLAVLPDGELLALLLLLGEVLEEPVPDAVLPVPELLPEELLVSALEVDDGDAALSLSLEAVEEAVDDGVDALLSLDELEDATEDGGVPGADLSTVVEEVEVDVRDSHAVSNPASSTGIRTPIALRVVFMLPHLSLAVDVDRLGSRCDTAGRPLALPAVPYPVRP